MALIKPIRESTVHKICSDQVVLSLAIAVKELIENALDASATTIDIRLKNYGVDLVEVADNGSGVAEENFAAMTLKHHTSKLNEYSDLLDVSSFGFRGEALSSLCALANVVITTRDAKSSYATKIEYDHNGHIVSKIPCSRQIGTTVALSNLFYSLPVRQKEFHKNCKREFNRMTQLLYAYCLVSVGVRITCHHQTSSNSKNLVVTTQGSSFKDNIGAVFGFKQLESLLEINPDYSSNIKENIIKGLSQEIHESADNILVEDIEINLSEDSNDGENACNTDLNSSSSCSQKSQGHKNCTSPVKFSGFISSCIHGCGRSSTDRQFFYVNSRPCEPTKVIKLVNEVYRQYNSNQYPFVFLNLNIEKNLVDVNVTPDKRKVFLTKEKRIIEILKNSLIKTFESVPKISNVESSGNINIETSQQPRIFNSFLQQYSKSTSNKESLVDKERKADNKRKSNTLLNFVSTKLSKNCHHAELSDVSNYDNRSNSINVENNEALEYNDKMKLDNIEADKKEVMFLAYADELPTTQIRTIEDIEEENPGKLEKIKAKHSILKHPNKKIITDKHDLRILNKKIVNLNTSLEHVRILSNVFQKYKSKTLLPYLKFRSAIDPLFNKNCEEELSREINKDSFLKMKIIGQFNLGFIITQLDDDLFIIDQHATDEIYNFEKLEKTTELTNQNLVIPQQLELTGVNEQILVDNMEIFKKNGFLFEINENAPPTKRVKLLTIPMSRNWIFGKEDIEELLFMLRESPSEYCRPSRVRAMFASRACRKSVMIGTALSKSDMKKLVDHMAEIDKPWNCPHGRPTIRHLVNLTMIQTQEE